MKTIYFGGKFVCAGFNDSHMHLLNFGYTAECCNLTSHTSSLAELQGALRAFIQSRDFPPDGWVMGRGWNQDYFAGAHEIPTRYDEVIATFRELEDAGELTLRVYEQSHFSDLAGLRGFLEKGYHTGAGDRLFKIGLRIRAARYPHIIAAGGVVMKKILAYICSIVFLFCLTACGQGEGDEIRDLIVNKTFVYEKEGFGGDFTIRIDEDGTYSYYEGFLSSIIGMGSWAVKGGVLVLSDDSSGWRSFVNCFEVQDGDLVFLSEGSSNFTFVDVADRERFVAAPDSDG